MNFHTPCKSSTVHQRPLQRLLCTANPWIKILLDLQIRLLLNGLYNRSGPLGSLAGLEIENQTVQCRLLVDPSLQTVKYSRRPGKNRSRKSKLQRFLFLQAQLQISIRHQQHLSAVSQSSRTPRDAPLTACTEHAISRWVAWG